MLQKKVFVTKQTIDEINRLFLEQHDDGGIYLDLFPLLTDSLLSEYIKHRSEGFRQALEYYDTYVGQPLSFSYCDTVANFYEHIFTLIDDPTIRRLILHRLLEIGISHNRWHVQGVFCGLIGSINDPSTALVAVEIIKSNPEHIQQLKDQLLEKNPIKIIEDAILETTSHDLDEDGWLHDIPF